MKIIILLLLPIFISAQDKLLIPMDFSQENHLKAYGITFNWVAENNIADWLLNYKGGSFIFDYSENLAQICRIKGVTFQQISQNEAIDIYTFVQDENQNMEVIRLEKSPKIAVYVPPNFQPWDDAVTLALEYAEVKYDKIWATEILTNKLENYDWLHLHHEDFTGQYGKFYSAFRTAPWYIEQQNMYESEAKSLGFSKVSEMEKAVVREIKNFVGNGGFLFAMCSATDTYDIALATQEIDIADWMYDGDGIDSDISSKLNYENTFAFTDFKIEENPLVYEYSDIDIQQIEIGSEQNDYFTLFDFSAKFDPVPTMLTQNHINVIHGFMGQTTMFRKELIKKSVTILAEREGTNQVRYIHGSFGRGTFTFYGGHDPEDYRHAVGDPQTELSLFKNSPGYRLILNNILFPAAKKKKQKT